MLAMPQRHGEFVLYRLDPGFVFRNSTDFGYLIFVAFQFFPKFFKISLSLFGGQF
jgi:hypothetical protein